MHRAETIRWHFYLLTFAHSLPAGSACPTHSPSIAAACGTLLMAAPFGVA